MDWLFYLVSGSVFGFFLIMGWLTKVFRPRKINKWYGYRTKLTMANQQNWDYAHLLLPGVVITSTLIAIVGYTLLVLFNELFLHLPAYYYCFVAFPIMMADILFALIYTHQKTANFARTNQ